MNPILLAFVTGLTTGGISCIAVQGGLLASAISQKKEGQGNLPMVGMFLGAKVFAYTILGFALGALGSALTITPQFQGWMQIAAGLYMLVTAANLLNLHPIFRYVSFQPPRFAYRFMRNQSKTGQYFTPALLGALTVLIPCGITQGMMVMAVASGNPLLGTGILFAFTLGTSPVFATLGLTASKLMERKAFLYIGSAVIIVLGFLSINTGQVLRGSAHTVQNYWKVIASTPGEAHAEGKVASLNTEGKQEVTVDVSSNGYKTSAQTLKAGVPVRLTLKTSNTQGCSRAFTIPSLNISKVLPESGEEILEFTPTKTGSLTYTCSMGMFSGVFKVI
jgi:sulfite exporter TauE/SafE